MTLDDTYAILTTHARDRLVSSGVSPAKAYWMLYHSEKEKLDRGLRRGKEYRGIDVLEYYRYGSFIFTLRPIVDKRSGDQCYLIITVTDQRVTGSIYDRP